MMNFLVKKFIPDYPENNVAVRTAAGVLSGTAGIFFNLLLFAAKLTAGILSNSIAIVADAFNNLSDAGSSIITMIGFRLAGHKADAGHPFGHGRIEYITGMLVSTLICIMGFSLARESLGKILHPQETSFTSATALILILSIAVKLYMFCYNRRFAKDLNSVALASTALDSRNDTITTALVLLGQLAGFFFHIRIDAWLGLGVAVFILISGFGSMIETVNPLLGQEPDQDLVKNITASVMNNKNVLGMHDLMIHDYGPGRRMMSLHLEVPYTMTLEEAHELADRIEQRLSGEYGIETVIHVDPVDNSDVLTRKLREDLESFLRELGPDVHYHDFRTVHEKPHFRILFDVAVPYGFRLSDQEVTAYLKDRFHEAAPGARVIISVDHYAPAKA